MRAVLFQLFSVSERDVEVFCEILFDAKKEKEKVVRARNILLKRIEKKKTPNFMAGGMYE